MYSNSRRLIVYTPSEFPFRTDRLRIIIAAVKRTAEQTRIETVAVRRKHVLSLSVFYEEDAKETWIYSDWQKNWSEDKIYKTLIDFMLTLHFTSPRQIRIPIIKS